MKQYTTLRQFYAWIGFGTLLFLAYKLLVWHAWAIEFIKIHT